MDKPPDHAGGQAVRDHRPGEDKQLPALPGKKPSTLRSMIVFYEFASSTVERLVFKPLHFWEYGGGLRADKPYLRRLNCSLSD